jgi:8-oxo-dGTP pyrophosphatase MutT (NUDIX family)
MLDSLQINGVGAWLRVEGQPGTAVLLPVLEEDLGKQECVGEYAAGLREGMLGLIGGGIEDGQTPIQALQAEAYQERGLEILETQIEDLGRVMEVGQIRGGQEVQFAVGLFAITLTPVQWSALQAYNPTVIDEFELPAQIDNLPQEKLRPFAWGFLRYMAETRSGVLAQ